MAIKVLLYHYGEYLSFMEERYKVVEDALRSFNLEIYQKEFPFRDEASKKFLHKTYNIQYVDDNDRYAITEADRIYAIQDLSSYMKEGLALIKNSQKGYYTHITQTEDRVTSAVTHWDDDLLVAFCVDSDSFDDVLFWYREFDIVNFSFNGKETTLHISGRDYRGEKIVYENEYYKIYQIGTELYADGYFFFRQFQYDWRRDLLDLEWHIDCTYKNPNIFGEFNLWYEAGAFADKKVFSHIKFMKNTKFFSRRLAVMQMEYLDDDTVRMSKVNTVKYPSIREILDAMELQADVKKTFFLVVDVDETIRSSEDVVQNCVFGGWAYQDHYELFDVDGTLLLFRALISEFLHKKLQFCEQ